MYPGVFPRRILEGHGRDQIQDASGESAWGRHGLWSQDCVDNRTPPHGTSYVQPVLHRSSSKFIFHVWWKESTIWRKKFSYLMNVGQMHYYLENIRRCQLFKCSKIKSKACVPLPSLLLLKITQNYPLTCSLSPQKWVRKEDYFGSV